MDDSTQLPPRAVDGWPVPSKAHDVAVAVLGEQPELLALLLEVLLGVRIGALERDDSTLRFTRSLEVRPDLVFKRDGGARVAVEVQGEPDDEKWRRWATTMAVQQEATGLPGDLIVITTSPAVAVWAKTVAHVRGPLGTTMTVTPVVLLLTEEVIERLLDQDHPALAFFAAWAMRERHGPEAIEVVRRAMSVTERLPEALRGAQLHAICQVLSAKMLVRLEEVSMDVSKLPPESPYVRKVREQYVAWMRKTLAEGEAKGEAKGKAEGAVEGTAQALLTVLEARGFLVPAAERARIRACTDLTTLDRWIAQAVAAKSLDAALE